VSVEGFRMITKEYGKYILICDICEEKADETFDSFDGAVDYRSDNWARVKLNGVMADVCPDCQV
jgi:hypothetical protein